VQLPGRYVLQKPRYRMEHRGERNAKAKQRRSMAIKSEAKAIKSEAKAIKSEAKAIKAKRRRSKAKRRRSKDKIKAIKTDRDRNQLMRACRYGMHRPYPDSARVWMTLDCWNTIRSYVLYLIYTLISSRELVSRQNSK
jgi:hypothetical protein